MYLKALSRVRYGKSPLKFLLILRHLFNRLDCLHFLHVKGNLTENKKETFFHTSDVFTYTEIRTLKNIYI